MELVYWESRERPGSQRLGAIAGGITAVVAAGSGKLPLTCWFSWKCTSPPYCRC